MPHFVIEYSEPLEPAPDIDGMMRALCDAATETGLMRRADIKLRAIPHDRLLRNRHLQNEEAPHPGNRGGAD